jgi:predicted RNase H-like HicB family nuclease
MKKATKSTKPRADRTDSPSELQYEVILYWSKADQAVIAEVPELPGCAADGANYQEAVEAVEVVMRQWIETAKKLGRPIPQPKGRLLFA